MPFSVRRMALVLACLCAASACSIDTQGTGAENNAGGGPGPGVGGSSGSGAGATSGSGAGASAGSGASGAGGTGPENCLDGKDNDGNDLVDCADPACKSGYECDPAVPSGWQGYYRLFGQTNDASAQPPIPCPDGSQPTRMYTNPAAAACSQCQCGAVTGAQCSGPNISCSTTARDCGGAADWTANIPDSNCHKNGNPTLLSCEVPQSTVTNPGTCAPSGGTYTNASHEFDDLVDVCGGTQAGGGCSTGAACVPRASGEYAAYLCIQKAGDSTQVPNCPAGWGTKPFIVAYQSGVDQRGCSPCQCTPTGESCNAAAYTFYDESDCTTCSVGCDNPITVSTACQDVTELLDGNTWSAKLTVAPSLVGGSCAPSGGQPTGSVQGQGAMTFCCQAL
jgi:hypothetical protein